MLDKDKSRLPVAIKDVIIIGVGVIVVWLGIWFAFGANPFYVVSSGSMEPVLEVNDVLIVRDGGSWEDLTRGDIIVFNRPEGSDRVIVHRIADIDVSGDGERIVRTRGDANPASIPGTDYPIRQDDYIGKLIYVIPGIGVIKKVRSSLRSCSLIGLAKRTTAIRMLHLLQPTVLTSHRHEVQDRIPYI